jgi:hypothetical protein
VKRKMGRLAGGIRRRLVVGAGRGFQSDGRNFRHGEASEGWRSPTTLGRKTGSRKKICGRRFAVMIEGARETMVREIRPYPAKPGQQYYEISSDAARVGQTRPPILRNFSGSRQTPPRTGRATKSPRARTKPDICGQVMREDVLQIRSNPAICGHDKTRRGWSAASGEVQKKNVDRCSS